MRRIPSRSAQQGMFLIEALISMLIFMMGILALLSVSSMAVSAQSGAQYRTEASQLANEISQAIWVGVDRTNPAALRTSLLGFEHQATGDSTSCEYSGSPSSVASVTNWVGKVTAATTGLPGATSAMQQIKVDTTDGTNQVTINVCWHPPGELATRRHVLITVVN